jgi:hypothetical protein
MLWLIVGVIAGLAVLSLGAWWWLRPSKLTDAQKEEEEARQRRAQPDPCGTRAQLRCGQEHDFEAHSLTKSRAY